jgi:hypothetical protein
MQQFRCKRRIPRVSQIHLVFLLDFVARMRQTLRQITIICKKKQTFSLSIESSNREQSRKFLGEQIKYSIASVLILPGGNEPGGFVKNNRERGSSSNELAICLDVIGRTRLRAEVCAGFAIDCDATCRDQFVTISPRTDTGSSQIPVQTHKGDC